ncbi:MAG: tetratricopeptide repeat protein [Cellvibrio sp.]|nr:tetratricopeptide repeat protein [Cellvibrio sp.]
MSVHLTEEEQIESLKRWWKDYGKSVVVAAVIAVAAYLGWGSWKDQQRAKAEKASATYEQLVKLINQEPGKVMSDTDRSMATQYASELKSGNNKSFYAQTAAFFLAKVAVEDNKLDQAVAELQWVLSAKPDVTTEQIARLRLAKVLTAKQSLDDALAQLAQEPAAALASDYAEARGDIYKLQGNLEKARSSYEAALTASNAQQQERYMLLQMKVDDLKLLEPANEASAEKAQ